MSAPLLASPAAVTADSAERLRPGQLQRRCDPAAFPFRSTTELVDQVGLLGQDRAVESIEFGLGIRRTGYHLFVHGPAGTGKHAVMQRVLHERATAEPPASDYCYVHNFDLPSRPRAIVLPPGQGARFRDEMVRLIEDVLTAVTAALEKDEYRARHEEIEREFENRHDAALLDLRDRAAKQDVALIRTPVGFALAAMRDGSVLDPDTFNRLSEDERARITAAMKTFEAELDHILHEIPKWRRGEREKLRELKRAVTSAAVAALIDELRKAYDGQPVVQAYLSAVEQDVIEHADEVRLGKNGEEAGALQSMLARLGAAGSPLARYQVNLLENHRPKTGAPVLYEDNPTFQNLLGRIEHVSHMGTLVTDFTLIKAGALHRANGGYLILDARRVLTEPFAWAGLKRALRSRELRVESLAQALGLVGTVSLEPEPIPLDVKVVLIGDRLLYYLLYVLDPDFRDLFKVSVDFQDSVARTDDMHRRYAALIATQAREERLRPLTAAAVARVIDRAARLAGDGSRLSLGLQSITDLLRESDHWAARAGRDAIDAADIDRTIDAQIRRAAGPRDRLYEEIGRGTIAIVTDGRVTGQVNGLSVAELGDLAFARPSRITARVRLGAGTVLDIEREVELGGPIHSKGVLILAGWLAARYVSDQPLSLSASIVFEQSYGPIEGDSASSAELCALLSALADLPVSQSLAVTGSMNQRGEIQAVGGVNEKIEGFFDICRQRGLTGQHGVLIPRANLPHLMLRDDVVEAVRDGRFQVFAVATIDQAMELLTGVAAGERDADGQFPADSVNYRVEQRLRTFATQARAFRSPGAEAPRP
jgi:lon-related putative ATP-dependent protease